MEESESFESKSVILLLTLNKPLAMEIGDGDDGNDNDGDEEDDDDDDDDDDDVERLFWMFPCLLSVMDFSWDMSSSVVKTWVGFGWMGMGT